MDRLDTVFYPPLQPHSSGMLEVDDLHTLYWEEAGNPEGVPLVVLHGGPGGGIRPYFWRCADPATFRFISFDQRGCGRSRPFACLERNTTQHLTSDIEALRTARGVDRWIVVGSSWGSALGASYVQTYPQSCLGAVLFGVIMERPEDLWWWWEGVRYVFPEVWEAFRDALPPEERCNLRENYVRRVLDPDPAIHAPAAAAWLRYEGQTLDVWPNEAAASAVEINERTSGAARVFAHYDAHDFFLGDSELIRNAPRAADVPTFIFNGRHDMCTPPRAAWDLHKAWPNSEFTISPVSGHRWMDEILGRDLVRGITRVAELAARRGRG